MINKILAALSLLLIAACSPPKKELTGIVQLYCYAAGGPRSGELIIDTENWTLLHYDIDADQFKELITTPGWKKGVEVTWSINKQDETLTIASREAFTKNYFEDRTNKSNRAHRNMKRYGSQSVMFNQQELLAFDKFTEARREDYELTRTKIDLKTLSAELYHKKKWGFMDDSQATRSGTGMCLVSEPPKTLMAAD